MHTSASIFLQLAIILTACRLTGLLMRKIKQPQVMGEIIAGVIMGPSLFGLLAPDTQRVLFSTATSEVIYGFGKVGLVLYVFLMGLEFEPKLIRENAKTAVSVSVAGILMPFALGSMVAILLNNRILFPENVPGWQSIFFFGTAMSITAFPVLARIISERGLAGTRLGMLALTAGSFDDAAAWCILGVLLALSNNQPVDAVITIGGALLYAVAVFTLIRPLLRYLGGIAEKKRYVNASLLSLVLILLMLGAWFTEMIGIHYVFGAIILGLAVPRGIFARDVQQFLQPVVMSLLIPLFFVHSGLNTSIGLVSTFYLWSITLLILATASVGKGVACWAAARLSGEPNRNAIGIGALMNARGLMELIILNIGLERGIITPTLFTIMVIMTAVTTLMATPIFEFVYKKSESSTTAGDTEFSVPAYAQRMGS